MRHKNEIRRQLIVSKELDGNNIDFEKLNKTFLDKFPEFSAFENEYNNVSIQYKVLTEQIQNLTNLFKTITTYNMKISNYFGK